jgi:hypothetical protein
MDNMEMSMHRAQQGPAACRNGPTERPAACIKGNLLPSPCSGLAFNLLPLPARLAALDIKRLTLEEPMQVDVSSAARRIEPLPL